MLDDRLLFELGELEKFKESSDYLIDYKIINDSPLKINFSLCVHKIKYEFIAEFPKYFPNQPIIITKITDFYTPHSYLNGTMCLKWGQDNWENKLTLAILIKNLYELLYDENPLGTEHNKSESGDEFSIGQELIYNHKVLIIPKNIECDEFQLGNIELVRVNNQRGNDIYLVSKIDNQQVILTDRLKVVKRIHYFCVDKDFKAIKKLTIKSFFNLLKKMLDYKKDFLLISNDNIGIFVSNQGKNKEFIKILSSNYEVKARTQLEDQTLMKNIVMLGLGSVGSRVFVDLARAGYNNFTLIDDDVMLPYNKLRHELTERHLGEYKVNSLKKLIIDEINPKANIYTITMNLLAQESSITTDNILRIIEKADLIIDSTANNAVLTMIDLVASSNDIPVISGTVINGGVGNIILYRKSGDEFSLGDILNEYYRACNSIDIIPTGDHDYEATIDNQKFVATMSDCSIVAGMMGKMAINELTNGNIEYSRINIFSTGNYGYFGEPFKNLKCSCHKLSLSEEKFEPEIIEKGREIYENYNSKRNSK